MGMKWAIDVINEGGGLKVGNDTYMVELVTCDGTTVVSKQAECATYFIYDQQVHYLSHLGQIVAVMPIFDEGKAFTMTLNATPMSIDPEFPYSINGITDFRNWLRGFYTMATKYNPDIKTAVVVNADDITGVENMENSLDLLPNEFGIEVLGSAYYVTGTQDFYPILTKLLAKNPDVIDYSGGSPGNVSLLTKQACELGFKGQFWNPAHAPLASMSQIVDDWSCLNGRYKTNEPDYSSDAFPASTHAIYADFNERYPEKNGVMGLLVQLGYAHAMFYAQAIETAQSVDPEVVMNVFDDPTWRFDWFGDEGGMGGVETGGIRRAVNAYVTYSEVIDGEIVTKENFYVEVP
jgi:ABC-type branched-subunit amino acid transport system substrate-binding protein